MPKLKAEFRKPKLTLYNTNYVALGVLTNKTHLSAHNITLSKQVNDVSVLTFDFPMGGLIDGDSTELLVKYQNEYFVIKEVSMSDSEQSTISVKAEHIVCELKGIVVGYFEEIIGGTPKLMWETVISQTSMSEAIIDKYVFETNIVDTYRYLGSSDEQSVFEYLLTIAQQFDSCLLFSTDAYGKIHINLYHGDIDRKKFVRKGRDLKQLDLVFNTESLFTRLTAFGGTDDDGVEINLMDVNDGKSYITDFSYYLAKGMTQEEIDNNPLCNQECVYRNEDILDDAELLRLARLELEKLSTPIVQGNISTIDLNVFEGSLYLSPILCEKIIVIDKDLEYSISCKVTSISYNFDNPLESQIGISNVISYSSSLKELIQTGEILDRVITEDEKGKPSLNASKVVGIINGHIAQLQYSMMDNVTDVTDAVILFECRIVGSELFGALAIGSRGILISRNIDPITNQWVWTTAIDASGISTQVLSAIQINGSQIKGDIISSYSNNTWINLEDGTFNFADKIRFDGKSFYINFSGTGLEEELEGYFVELEKIKEELRDGFVTVEDFNAQIQVTEKGILSTVSKTYTTKDEFGKELSSYVTKSELEQTEKDITATFREEHVEGYEEGIVTLNKDGIKVSHNLIGSYTNMRADGFFILDENNDVIAELSASERWSILKADEVYAKNIERVYMGDANLYIDHSKSSNGTGTAINPFNSFSALSSHFEDKGLILNKNVTVNIVCTSKDIVEQLYLKNLKGNGMLKINYNANCVHRNESSYNIILDTLDCHVWIYGGRTTYNSNNGAILAEATTNNNDHGIKIVGCTNVVVEGINISRTNLGAYIDRSHVRLRRIDFCDTWCCVEAAGCSHVSMEDCCGNVGGSFNGDAMRSQTGSMIVYGNGMGGSYVPYGHIKQYEGGCWKIGSPAQTQSFRTVPAKPPTTDYTQSFTSTNYGYYSVGQACWNPYGQKVYQGDWGYGNNKGIYTLPNSAINSFYSGSTIVSGATIKLSRATSGGYSASQYIYLCGTTVTTVGSGSNPPVTKSYGLLGSLAWGETKTFTLPGAFVADLKAGTIKSIMFYTSDGSNYILFGNSCTLTLKCNK